MPRYGSLKKTGKTYELFFSTDNFGQNIWQNVKDSSKIRYYQKL